MSNNLTIDGTLKALGSISVSGGTASATSGAATLNAKSGVVTTDSITTTGQSTYSLTVTNSSITTTDILVASVGNGTNTGGLPTVISAVPGAGIATFKIANAATTATNPFTGTLVVSFISFKP